MARRSAAETPFANTALGVGGLAAVGNYLLAQDYSGAWATHYIFNTAGVITDQAEWNYYSREYAWDPVTSRVYFFRDAPARATCTTKSSTRPGPDHHAGRDAVSRRLQHQPPIRVSPDSTRVLLGTGDLYRRSDLTWAGALGRTFTDAEWKANLLVTVNAAAQLEIWDPDTFEVLTSYQYAGTPIRLVFGQDNAYMVRVRNNRTTFVKLPFGDEDQDSMPQWWEELYGLSDSNAADASEDPDGDGVDNATEYLNGTNPLVP